MKFLKFPYASIPKTISFIKYFYKKKINNSVYKKWVDCVESYYTFSCSAFSIYFIAKWRLELNKKEYINLWVPDYFCNTSLIPLKLLKVKIIFYPINSDLTPNFEWLIQNQNINKPDIFILVHYFGKSFVDSNVNDFCKEHNTWLIDDATHVFLPTNEIGKHSDFTLYSLHKHLALADGALLLCNSMGISKLNTSIFCVKYDEKLLNSYTIKSSSFFAFNWFVKRFIQSTGVYFIFSNKQFWPDAKYINPSFTHISMSNISKIFLSLNINQLNSFVNIKKNNYNKILELFNAKSFLHFSINEIPYLTLIKCKNFESASQHFHSLKKIKLPVTTWPDLPNEIYINAEIHSVAINYRKNFVFISNNHSIKTSELEKEITKSYKINENDIQF